MAELEASAASMSTADHVDDVACSGDANQPPPAGAVHDAALAGQIRSVTCDGRLDDRASGEAPSASMESSSDATTSTPCPKCANRHARTKHTCGKARNAPSVLAAPARASRRSRSATEPVADQPASQSPRFATAHASARSARDDGSSTSSNAPVTQSPTGPHDVEMQEAKQLGSPGIAPSGDLSYSPLAQSGALQLSQTGPTHLGIVWEVACAHAHIYMHVFNMSMHMSMYMYMHTCIACMPCACDAPYCSVSALDSQTTQGHTSE